MKVLPVVLIVVGIVWGLANLWFHLVMSGIAEPVCRACAIGAILFGPFLLILGALFVLIGWHAKVGAIMTLVACGILTLFVAYGTSGFFHIEPLQPKPDMTNYAVFAAMIIITLLADAGAVRLFQLVSSATNS